MTSIKICGFQKVEHVIAAASAGADTLGFVFVPAARRRLTLERAKTLLAEYRRNPNCKPSIQIVGLFANQPVHEVNATAEMLSLDAVQLSGSEGMDYCAQIDSPVYKTIHIDASLPSTVLMPKLMVLLQRHTMAGHRLILDTQTAEAFGGSGQTFDWNIAADLSGSFEFSLAGGLTPENAGNAIKLVRPWGVDTSSGVEINGEKDVSRIEAFIQAVRFKDRDLNRNRFRRIFHRNRG